MLIFKRKKRSIEKVIPIFNPGTQPINSLGPFILEQGLNDLILRFFSLPRNNSLGDGIIFRCKYGTDGNV